MNKDPNLINDPQIIKTKDDARQGKTGMGVRYVLIFGLIGVVVAFIIVFMTLSK